MVSFWEIILLSGTMATILGVFLTIYGLINKKSLKEESKLTREEIKELGMYLGRILERMDKRSIEFGKILEGIDNRSGQMGEILDRIDKRSEQRHHEVLSHLKG